MKRGDLVRVALPGDYGKPRPAVVIQSDVFSHLPSVTVLPITSDLRDVPQIRVTVEPDLSNRLKVRSQIMIDKASTLSSNKAGVPFGRLAQRDLLAVDQALVLFFDLASTPQPASHAGEDDESR
jgi:mRNA interferase MazF